MADAPSIIPDQSAEPRGPAAHPATSAAESFAGVRLARPDDEDAIYRLLLLLNDENAIMPLSEKRSREAITRGTHGGGGIIGVIDGPDGIEASVGLEFGQFFYTEAWHLNELWFHVHPDHRRTTHARRLVEFAKWCADQLSAGGVVVPLLFGVVTRARLLPKMRLFARHAPQIGALYVHGLDVPDTYTQRSLAKPPKARAAPASSNKSSEGAQR